MIERAEVREWADRFGVGTEQIARDHLISHVLAALDGERDVGAEFYGGTALCRSYLDGTRLSEDIDLLHPAPASLLADLADAVPSRLQREFPDLEWNQGASRDGSAAASLGAQGLTSIHLEIGRLGPEHRAWSFAPTEIALRYSDLPAAVTLRAPSLETFAAMKMLAWYDRHAPRDLFDLAGLSDIGAVNATSEALVRATAHFGFQVVEFTTLRRLTIEAWDTELGAQVGALPTAQDCAARVLARIEQLRE